MKHYMKFLMVGALCGIVCIVGYTMNDSDSTMKLSDIILLTAFYQADYLPQYIPYITYWYMPLLLFHVFYGTYIYRHFCSASVYFFSRYCSRTKWFLKETFILYLFGIAFLLVTLFSGVLVTSLFTTVTVDKVSILILVYYIFIYSLFLLVSTLGINILAVLFTSNVGFVIIQGIILFGIAFFTIMGKYFITDDKLLDKFTWMLKLNPFAHLVFSMHSSTVDSIDTLINTKGISFDLNLSIVVFLVSIVLLVAFGCVVVNNHNFIDSNKETGGV